MTPPRKEYPGNKLREQVNIVDEKSPTDLTKAPKTTPTPKVDKGLQAVVKKPAVEYKPSLGERLKGSVIGGEARNVASYIATDVLLPNIRNLIVDMTQRGIERLIYGDAAPRRSPSRTNYGSMYSYTPAQPPRRPRPNLPDQTPRRPRLDNSVDLVLDDREEAELVLQNMYEALSTYEVVSVADFRQLAGHSTSFVDRNWGWYSLQGSGIRQTPRGWLIILPSPEPI